MDKRRLRDYMYQHIPLAEFMQIDVARLDQLGCELQCPLSANKNDKAMAFGGSLTTLATLSCWANVFRFCEQQGWRAEVLIRKSEARFLKPGRSDLRAICQLPDSEEMEKFIKSFERKGKARLNLNAEVVCQNETVLSFEGQFAVMSKNQQARS